MTLNQEKLWGSLSWPNRFSLLRLLLVAPFIVLLMNQDNPSWQWGRHAAIGIFLLMAVSDFLDGLLARRLDAKTRLGAILDPLADKVLIICSVVLLSLPGSAVEGARLDNWVVVAVVGKDLWVILGFVVIYLVTDRFRVQPTLAGKACTFGQLTMVASVLVAPDLDLLWPKVGGWIAFVTGIGVSLLCLWAVISYTRLGLRFIAKEEKPLEDPPAPTKTNGEASRVKV